MCVCVWGGGAHCCIGALSVYFVLSIIADIQYSYELVLSSLYVPVKSCGR